MHFKSSSLFMLQKIMIKLRAPSDFIVSSYSTPSPWLTKNMEGSVLVGGLQTRMPILVMMRKTVAAEYVSIRFGSWGILHIVEGKSKSCSIMNVKTLTNQDRKLDDQKLQGAAFHWWQRYKYMQTIHIIYNWKDLRYCRAVYDCVLSALSLAEGRPEWNPDPRPRIMIRPNSTSSPLRLSHRFYMR